VVDHNDTIKRILNGDSRAFEVIIKDYGRLVNHIVYRMIPNTDERDDIVQDILMRIYRNLGSFKRDAKLSTWIGRIAYNRCLDYLDKKKVILFDDAFEDAIGNIPDQSSSPEETIEKKSLSEALKREIDKLPEKYKTILTLYHIDELSYDEIGKVAGLPEGTVKSYLFRARKALKERLESRYKREELWQ